MESEYTSVSRLRFHPKRYGRVRGRLQHHRDSGFQVSVTRCLFSLFPVPGYLRPRAIPTPLLHFTLFYLFPRAIFHHRFSSFSIQRHLSSVSYFSDSSLSSISFQHFFQRFKVFIGKEVLKCIFIYCTVKSRRILTFVWKKR